MLNSSLSAMTTFCAPSASSIYPQCVQMVSLLCAGGAGATLPRFIRSFEAIRALMCAFPQALVGSPSTQNAICDSRA